MERRTVRLQGGERWLEWTVGERSADARVGGPSGVSEPFAFSFEHLGYVPLGLGYQAWGESGHFAVRRDGKGFAIEFQNRIDRGLGVCRMSAEEFAGALRQLSTSASAGHPSAAEML